MASLKDGGWGATLGRERHRVRSALVVSQVALALVLLIGAGLMIKSFWHLKNVNAGFRPEGALTFHLSLTGSDYPDRETAARFQQRLIDRLSALPAVQAVGAVTCLPLTGCRNVNPPAVEGMYEGPDDNSPGVRHRVATDGYFQAIGIPLLEGRTIERVDHERRSGVAVVSRTLAQRFWPGESAIGQRIYPTIRDDPAWYTIVGVVGDVRSDGLTQEPLELVYFPMLGTDDVMISSAHSLAFVVKVDGPPLALAAPVRNAVWELDPNLPVADLRALEHIVSRAEAPMAFAMLLLGIAGAVALTLGVIGVYGVLSYIVSQRKGEIGVRIALGAQAGDVNRMILRHGAGVAALGMMLGLGGAVALTRLMGALLFDVEPTDLATYSSVSVALFLAALLASYFPARRAARQDPVEALRSE